MLFAAYLMLVLTAVFLVPVFGFLELTLAAAMAFLYWKSAKRRMKRAAVILGALATVNLCFCTVMGLLARVGGA